MSRDRPNTVVTHIIAQTAPQMRVLITAAVAMLEAEKAACQSALMEAEPRVREAAALRHPEAPWRYLASPEALAFEQTVSRFLA